MTKESKWTRTKITVPIHPDMQEKFGSDHVTIPAQALGDYAYHAPVLSADDEPLPVQFYTITHIPTGHRIPVTVRSWQHARQIIRALSGVPIETVPEPKLGPEAVVLTPRSLLAFLQAIALVADDDMLYRVVEGDFSHEEIMAQLGKALSEGIAA